ncbi:hypothetical protein ALC62_11176 [Cyphomyrmex costatus]|uniref:Uncharacterized protein n=1 Tax=Cyphomyrmex costatus TaxID=456900 RepID=A0A195CBW3_9HYME|nr:hypothetical protein ALC62_11176 [Cyphomyrmex costatus]
MFAPVSPRHGESRKCIASSRNEKERRRIKIHPTGRHREKEEESMQSMEEKIGRWERKGMASTGKTRCAGNGGGWLRV